MKKLAIFTLGLLLIFLPGTSFGVEVTLFGPTQYLRTKGKPNAYAATFPGIAGTGSLIIKTGDADDKDRDNKDRDRDDKDRHDKDAINSALIFLNGKQIGGPKDFRHKAHKTEIPIKLAEQNSLSVELRGEPGSYLSIQVKENILAEAAAVIGPKGGLVEISDYANPLFGWGIDVPPGTLSSGAILSISVQNVPPSQPLPGGAVQDGPVISLNSTNPNLQGPVYLSLPFTGTRQTNEARLVFTYNTNMGQWETVAPLPTPDPGVFRAILWHFSDYAKGTATITDTDITASFKVGTDSLEYTNTVGKGNNLAFPNNEFPEVPCSNEDPNHPGVCAGLSLLSTDYFNLWPKYGKDSLMCHWSAVDAAKASCDAFGIYMNYFNNSWVYLWNVVLYHSAPVLDLDYSYIVDFVRHSAGLNVVTPLVLWGNEPDSEKPGQTKQVAHSVVAYGWQKVDDSSGWIEIYNVNNNKAGDVIAYGLGTPLPLTQFSYASDGATWTAFAIQPRPNMLDVAPVFNDFPGDQVNEQGCSISVPCPPNDTSPPVLLNNNFINNGAGITSSRTVTVNLAAEDNCGISAYSICNEIETLGQPCVICSLTASPWISILPTKAFNENFQVSFPMAQAGDILNVSIWLRDMNGNYSPFYCDTITYKP